MNYALRVPTFILNFLAAPPTALGIFVAVLLALSLFVFLYRQYRPGVLVPLAVVAAGYLCLLLGGLLLPPVVAFWLLATTGVAFLAMTVLLLAGGVWSRWAALAALAVALFALGGVCLFPAVAGVTHAFSTLLTLDFTRRWWLLLQLVVPLVFLIGYRNLYRTESRHPWLMGLARFWAAFLIAASLVLLLPAPLVLLIKFDSIYDSDSGRAWAAAVLRTAGVVFLALALAEPVLRDNSDNVAVLFVLDRSQSIPEDFGDDPNNLVDHRAVRVRKFINDAVELRGNGHERDRAGLIVFGKHPRLELPPSDAPRFNLPAPLPAATDGNYTDIAAALKMALASFPEGYPKRVVLLSDGNENLGNVEEEARVAKKLGVQIDVVPLGAGQRNEDEVLVERVQAPPQVEQGGKVPIRVLVRSFNPNVVVGTLTLKQITEGEVTIVGKMEHTAKLRKGLNPFSFSRPVNKEQRSYTYEAEFQPEWIEDEDGVKIHNGPPPGDRKQNNRASAHVVARGQRRILVLEGKAGDHHLLVEKLLAAGKDKYKVVAQPVTVLDTYKDRETLAVFLSNFDCVILANVSADQVSEEQQEMLRSNTHDQGCGLIMIGGPDGFGAGGWQGTTVEKALPVDSEIKSLKVQGKGGLVLIMHGCEMNDGNVWEKKIAKLAIDRLGPADEIGVIDGNQQWHLPLKEIGDNRAQLKGMVDKLIPGDMADFDIPLKMAYDALMDPAKKLATKHVIIISDGDPIQNDPKLLPGMKADKVTVSTVGVATHGPNEDAKMKVIAQATGGKAYSVTNPNQLPAIYIKESRIVSQSFIERKDFEPIVVFRTGPADVLPDRVPHVKGYVRTTPKASGLVEIPLVTPKFADQDFPLLAYWHYGLGKGVAFTSDAGDPEKWFKDWEADGLYAKFWERVIDWSLRPTESANLTMTTEFRDGKIHVIVDARTPDGKPDVNLQLRVGVTTPDAKGGAAAPPRELRFKQTNSGVYEVDVTAEEAGSYFLNAQAVRIVKVKDKDGKEHEVEEPVDGVRSGVTLPYSPEFSELETNEPLLKKLAEMTEGEVYKDADADLAEAARSGVLFRPFPPGWTVDKGKQPVWHWLLFLAGVLLFLDVATRRLSLDPQETGTAAYRYWARLRGLPLPPDKPEYAERLQTRRPLTGAAASRGRSGRRFEAAGDYGEAPPGADAAVPPPPPGGRPRQAPGRGDSPAPAAPEPEAGDFLARMKQAKKRALGDKKDKPPEER